MIIYYLRVAFRNLARRKLYTMLNISGLALGIASFLIIGLYIVNELSYDRYHEHSDRIYRVCQISDFGGVGENSASLPFPVAFTLKAEYPGLVEEVTRVFNFQSPRTLIEHGDRKFVERRVYFADSTFFDVFDYEFLLGNPDRALDESMSMVISESAAEKYFGDENPLGQSIQMENKHSFRITGVIRDVPDNSHFHMDFIGSMSSVRKFYRGHLPASWVWNPCWTYLLLPENVNPEQLEVLLPGYTQKYFFDAERDNITLYLQPLTDIHLKSRLDYEIEPNSNIAYVYILSAIAVFLLLIASINFMNLATATSSGRAREIGMKKVVGAYKTQLIGQFIGESVVITVFSAILALIIAEIFIPWFNRLTGQELSLQLLLQWEYLLGFAGIVVLIGTISGLYPAFYLSSFKPASIFRKDIQQRNGSGTARKILVVTQFTISIALIIGTLLIFKQLNYLKNAGTGFQKENIIVIPIERTGIISKYASFKSELLNNPGIESVTTMDYILGTAYNTHEFRPEGYPDNEWQFYPALVVQHDFTRTFNLKIIAGRAYDEKHKTDPVKGILINRAMVEHLGWGDPQDALGKKFRSLEGNERVIGVVENFNAASLHKAGTPFVLNMKESEWAIHWFMNYAAVRVKPGNSGKTLDFLESKWNEFVKDRPFEYRFLDEELDQLYREEANLGRLALIFTLLVIFISSLGLFGLASYMAEKRTREIGIRKVMGAREINIICIMSAEFLRLMLIANLIAWPLAYLIIRGWLNHFAYQTAISGYIFIISGLFATLIALGITVVKSWQASRMNPVYTLKYE